MAAQVRNKAPILSCGQMKAADFASQTHTVTVNYIAREGEYRYSTEHWQTMRTLCQRSR